MLRPVSAVMCGVTAAVVAQLWIGRAGATIPARTPPIKWLINTGNMAGRWPPPSWTGRNSCNNTATPNTISRMQMIRGGTAAVLVMPTGDGGRRCCSDGTLAQFSLGLVDLKHGLNNLYPAVQPFPDWRTFVDEVSPLGAKPLGAKPLSAKPLGTEPPGAKPPGAKPPGTELPGTEPPVLEPPVSNEQDQNTTKKDERGEEFPADGSDGGNRGGHRRIINAVDAFLDDRGRILWVLDSGQVGEDACNGIMPSSCDGSKASDTDDQLLKPKFVAIDVYTNQVQYRYHSIGTTS